MGATARKYYDEDIIVLMEGTYDDLETKCRCHCFFKELHEKGNIKNNFQDDIWKLDNQVEHYNVSFQLDEDAYRKHGAKFLNKSLDEIKDAMKLYVLYYTGDITFGGIQNRIKVIRKVLENMGENLVIRREFQSGLMEFLIFMGLPVKIQKSIIDRITFKKTAVGGKRKLQPMITYEVAAEKSKEVMLSGSIEEKRDIFPVFFITNIGARIPRRPTEWTLTPYDCLKKTENGYLLTLRRTILKKGSREVGNDLDSDYELITYPVPDTEDIRIVQWYIEETKGHKRRFLFDYDETSLCDSLRKRFCLKSLNDAIAKFVEKYMNDPYGLNWLMSFYGIEKFEAFPAGDMRPLALINLFFSGVSLDVCMELAGHDCMETTFHYISNIKDTIETSSVMKMQKWIDGKRRDIDYMSAKSHSQTWSEALRPGCNSKKLWRDPMDLSDCKLECLDSESCIGCEHYNPTESEIEEYIREKEEEMDSAIADFRRYIKENCNYTLDGEIIRLQKAHEAYEEACSLRAQKEYERWKKLERRGMECIGTTI